jgi:hypothetical protein
MESKMAKQINYETYSWQDELSKKLGEKVAVLCTRYNYRGVLSGIGDSFLVLAHASAVERSGPCSGKQPVTEDPIQGTIFIKYDAIEIVFQPNWVNAPIAGENE